MAPTPGGALRSSLCRHLFFYLLVLCFFCDACKKVALKVPFHLQADTFVGRVNLEECLKSADLIHSSDPDFRILEDGSVYTTKNIGLSSEGRTFAILLSDSQKQEQKKIEIALLAPEKKIPMKRHAKDKTLKRTKRRWAPIPCSIMENSLGPFPQQIQQIQSDSAQNYTIYYSISGPGVDKEPFNLFYIERDTGDIFCTRAVDRETYDSFQITGYATTPDGYSTDLPLPLLIKVEDDNDNAPCFEDMITFNVIENCRVGTSVGKVVATDRDEPDTLHTRLKYTILKQIPENPKHFAIHPDTGVITTILTPDREACPTYILHVEARDMAGQSFGLSSTATLTIDIRDENDNAPTFRKTSYVTEVEENRINVEILRMDVEDKDLPNTPHSRAKYIILKGNENGQFQITTDPNTNAGILHVVKPLDYEAAHQIILQVGVVNEAEFSKGTSSRGITTCTTSVIVNVKDTDEGPECQPPVTVISSKDGMVAGKEIRGYTARDPETHSNEGLMYQKLKDEDNWFQINEKTGNLVTTKVLDRESPFVKNDQYNVTVLAVDKVGRSCTGTLVVRLEDENDNSPIIKKNVTICRHGDEVGMIEAVDHDGPTNGPPFKFTLDNQSSKLWTIQKKSDTSALIHPKEGLKSDFYSVFLRVEDRHGLGQVSHLKVKLCDCTLPSDCKMIPGRLREVSPSNIHLGKWAILAMVLGSALLLCVLFTCFCVTTKKTVQKCFPEDIAQQNLIVSNTEAPGEEVMEANIRLPTQTTNICEPVICSGTLGGQGTKTGGQQSFEMVKGYTLESTKSGGHQTLESYKGSGQGLVDTGRYAYTDWHSFTQPRLGEKVYHCGQDEEHKYSKDYVLPYDYEGKGSLAGSVGCCSDRQDEEGLEFLDHLEPKFRTLAKTCIKK
ncbi:desmocollin-1-like isoform X1 [Vombatus ursinus]|uniref:Cadherin domain-containing protein n=1 Tax=Vombatus ursinus TaxID=29139 RepID=A0A4X2K293_VOMUR|nr:desmocollin-1-like isoform X1 [Vombatus ursinus]XP_027733022.1 desmocollin-1-like isoform X1 [Vombatus ursinus]